MYIMREMKEKSTNNKQQNFVSAEDHELISEISNKNKVAFEEFFKRYANKVKFLMLKMGATNLDAEEISQEVMAILWRKSILYDPAKSSVASWVYTIARNYRVDYLRKGNRLVMDTDDPTFVPDPPLNSVQLLLKQERKNLVRNVLNTLSSDKKQLLISAFFEGLPHAELAKKFGQPLGTIKSRLRLIYGLLRKVEDLKPLRESDE